MVANNDSNNPTNRLAITVNGTSHTVPVPDHFSLRDVIQDVLGLTGAKRGCDRGECGSCTVLLDDIPVNSCQVLALRSAGRNVLTKPKPR